MENNKNKPVINRTSEEFYKDLKPKLEENHYFPEDYLFKFIFPNDNLILTEIYQVFDGLQYSITTKESGNAKYISVSLLVFVLDAEQVIRLYKKVAEINGVIML